MEEIKAVTPPVILPGTPPELADTTRPSLNVGNGLNTPATRSILGGVRSIALALRISGWRTVLIHTVLSQEMITEIMSKSLFVLAS